MKLITSLFSILLVVLTTCNGQTSKRGKNSDLLAHNAKGDTVKVLGNNIMVVYQDKKGNYWFGSWKDGMYKYDGKTILHFTVKDGLLHNRIEEIKEDEYGNIYFNTSKGINKFDGKTFTILPFSESNEWKLQPYDLWFKGNNGPCRYDGKFVYQLKLPKHYLEGKKFEIDPKHSWGPYDIYTIYKDSKGNIWFGTAVLGVCRYDGKSVEWISEEDVTEFHNGSSNGVRSIVEDRDGFFWFNTIYRYNVYGGDSSKSNFAKKNFYDREKGPGSLDGRKNGNMSEYLSITRDNDEKLWIVTYNAGVWLYDWKNFTHFSVQDNGKDITLFSIYKDNSGSLWLGTHENGAYKFNGKTFERFRPWH